MFILPVQTKRIKRPVDLYQLPSVYTLPTHLMFHGGTGVCVCVCMLWHFSLDSIRPLILPLCASFILAQTKLICSLLVPHNHIDIDIDWTLRHELANLFVPFCNFANTSFLPHYSNAFHKTFSRRFLKILFTAI